MVAAGEASACTPTSKMPAGRAAIKCVGATLIFSPPYRPDYNPSEQATPKLMAHVRKATERTIDGLWDAIGRILDFYAPQDCANYFAACRHDAD